MQMSRNQLLSLVVHSEHGIRQSLNKVALFNKDNYNVSFLEKFDTPNSLGFYDEEINYSYLSHLKSEFEYHQNLACATRDSEIAYNVKRLIVHGLFIYLSLT